MDIMNDSVYNLGLIEGYENVIMEELCSSPEIIHLVSDNKDLTVPCPKLAYDLIYPYPYVPKTVDEGKTFICYSVDIESVSNKTFLVPVLYIWEFTHESKLRLPEGGVRLNRLATETDKIFNGNRRLGLGTLELDSAKYFIPTDGFQGKVLTYYAKDFNRKGSKKPPAVRKHFEGTTEG